MANSRKEIPMKAKTVLATVACIIFAMAVWVSPVFGLAVETSAESIAAGDAHSLAVKSDGSVWGWGDNGSGQVGASGKESELVPVKTDGLDDVISVAAGFNYSAALTKGGDVYVWGDGEGKTRVNGLSGVVKINTGIDSVIALTEDGNVYFWEKGSAPAKVAPLPLALDIAAGNNHFLVLTATGRVYGWGENFRGQLGDGGTQSASAPVAAEGIYNVIGIGAGANHSFAITQDGALYAWGNNENGQLGVVNAGAQLNAPALVEGVSDIKQAEGGIAHSIALTQDGRVYAWGSGEFGQLGRNSIEASKVPMPVSGIQKAEAIAAGGNHSLVRIADGVKIWGRNNAGQIGDGNTKNILSYHSGITGVRADAPYAVEVLKGISSWAKADIQAMYDAGEIPLTTLWGFKNNITRGEFSALLVAAYEKSKNTAVRYSAAGFTDIAGHLYEEDINKAASLKIIEGISKTTFNPDGTLTREQAAKMLSVAYSLIKNTTIPVDGSTRSTYNDFASIGDWAQAYVAFANNQGIMQGSNRNFNPRGNLTKESAMVSVYRILH
jgi:alpha-tubulin suppressor-like RCC1 family protein